MGKKLILARMALVAFAAMALPAIASASPELCETVEGTCVKVTGEPLIRAHNDATPAKFVSGGATLWECSSAALTGKLTKKHRHPNQRRYLIRYLHRNRRRNHVQIRLRRTYHGRHEPRQRSSLLYHTEGNDTVIVRGGNCTEASRAITFALTTKNIGTCKYSRTEAFTGTYTTHSTGDAKVTFAPAGTTFTKEEGSVLCPASGGLEMKFTLETEIAGTQPLYIK